MLLYYACLSLAKGYAVAKGNVKLTGKTGHGVSSAAKPRAIAGSLIKFEEPSVARPGVFQELPQHLRRNSAVLGTDLPLGYLLPVVVHPRDWANSPLPYSYGIKSGNTLFLAGLVSRNGKDNTNVQGDITTQTKTVLDNAAAILKEAGMSYADVVQARVYITNKGNFQAMNAAYRPYFTGRHRQLGRR